MHDYEDLINSINDFSHAYLIKTNSLDESFDVVKLLSKRIICENNDELLYKNDEICNLIDENSFDDFYVVNPSTLSIKVEEVNKLMEYFSTKSIRNDGRRVYVIYGIERLQKDISNKLLKFIEEPEDNIYGIIMTENIDLVLPTIVSRCQILTLNYDKDYDNDDVSNMMDFLKTFMKKGLNTICYYNDYFDKYDGNRERIINCFVIIESILSNCINSYYGIKYDSKMYLKEMDNIDINKLTKMLDITNKLKRNIKNNINLNLLIDRYIIEMERGDNNA